MHGTGIEGDAEYLCTLTCGMVFPQLNMPLKS